MHFILVSGFGQTAIPYITHFESREGYENYNWSICQDDHNNMLFANKRDFTSHHIPVSRGDVFYLFSDGFADQFGRPKNKKYTIGRFKKLLISISGQPMEEQRRTLDAALKSWGGENLQVDDVLVKGVKF